MKEEPMLSIIVSTVLTGETVFGQHTHMRSGGGTSQVTHIHVSTSSLDPDKGLKMAKDAFDKFKTVLVRISYQSGFIDLSVNANIEVTVTAQFGNVESNPEVKAFKALFAK